MNAHKTILDLCGGTGSWSKYYAENGYNVVVATYPDWDVTDPYDQDELIAIKPYGILAAPPCTMFSIARQNARTPRDLRKGMECVQGCLRIIWESSFDMSLKFWAMENPMGYLKLFLGKAALVFQPFEYGDPYTKKTCIWGRFNEPIRKPVTPLDLGKSAVTGKNKDYHTYVEQFAHLKQIPDGYQKKTGYTKNKILRSMTPLGFAKQFYLANK